MLKDLGHTVIQYGVEGSEVHYADEFVSVLSDETFQKHYGSRDKNAVDHLSEEDGPAWDIFNTNCLAEINKRIDNAGKEFLINFLGYSLRPITENFDKTLICVEPGIGHNGSYLKNRIFESYAWQNFTYGKEVQPRQSYFPNNYDTVIPAYFDPNDYPFIVKKSDYYLYLGRVIWGKGVSVAIDITRELGKELIIIGGGDFKSLINKDDTRSLDHVTYKGVLSLKDKVKYLGNAKALLYFSLYVEPFGHAPIEAMLCGTPVITSDFGAFSETNIHGLTGYRANTFAEIYWAAQNVNKLDTHKIREYAINNYSLDRIKLKFQEHFEKLYNLYNGKDWYHLDKNTPLFSEHLIKYV
jgi:glycosyltransferase involved in cell wall biosynthesis